METKPAPPRRSRFSVFSCYNESGAIILVFSLSDGLVSARRSGRHLFYNSKDGQSPVLLIFSDLKQMIEILLMRPFSKEMETAELSLYPSDIV